jgi:hypothetical protein
MDPELFHHPFIYAVEPGAMDLNDEEAARLREYLLRGGFWHLDDFWGGCQLDNVVDQLHKVFPNRICRTSRSITMSFTPSSTSITLLKFPISAMHAGSSGAIPTLIPGNNPATESHESWGYMMTTVDSWLSSPTIRISAMPGNGWTIRNTPQA